MKETLIALIDDIPNIEKLFYTPHNPEGVLMIPTETISSVSEFQQWKQKVLRELLEIQKRNPDEFIKSTIDALNTELNSWHERRDFNNIKAKLLAVRENIDSYYAVNDDIKRVVKQPKIFISHKTEDKPYVEKIVRLIEYIGVKREDIFCSSMAGYGVPNSKDIFDFLREQFEKHELFMVFVHSQNYYNSSVSLNEMGAAWVLRNDYISILLPTFDFNEMNGVINSRTAGIKLDADIYETKDRLNQLRRTLANIFGLDDKENIAWERARDTFIEEVNNIVPQIKVKAVKKNPERLSECAEELLLNASKSDISRLLIYSDLSGMTIQTEPKSYSSTLGDRELSRWESAFEELSNGGYIKRYGKNNALYKLTDKGYTYLEINNIK